jgi:hypothetical protein
MTKRANRTKPQQTFLEKPFVMRSLKSAQAYIIMSEFGITCPDIFGLSEQLNLE